MSDLNIKQAWTAESGQEITVIGLLDKIAQQFTTQHRRRWALGRLADDTGTIEVLVFPNAYQRLGEQLIEGATVRVTAHTNCAECAHPEQFAGISSTDHRDHISQQLIVTDVRQEATR